MRIGLDVTPATVGGTGLTRYTEELHGALLEAGVDVVAFALGRGTRPHARPVRRVSVPLRVLSFGWRVTGRPRAERFCGPVDLVHSIDLEAPPSALPMVATVNDLVALEHPHLHPPRAVHGQEHRLAAAQRADAVIAVSDTTAQALVARGVDATKIVVVPLAWTPLPPAVPLAVHPGFLLAVGEVNRRKDLPTLVSALARAETDGLHLVVAGPHSAGPALTELESTIVDERMTERVQLLGPVTDGQLAWLYEHATALCFPTLAEGFGLPMLEAMATGCPVIVSDLPVLRETADGVALFAAAGDVDAFAEAIRRLATDDQLRAASVVAGRERAASYTWAATAHATIRVYREVIGARSGAP